MFLNVLESTTCESISLNEQGKGRLFQTFEAQTENVRLSNWVLVRQTTASLVVVDGRS